MHVTMVVGLFRPFGGGAERQAEALSVALQQRGIFVDVLTLCPRGAEIALPDDPVPVTRLRVPGFGRLKEISFAISVYPYLIKHKPDIVHIHQAEMLATGAVMAAKKLRIPSIVKCGNSGERFDLRITEQKYFCGSWLKSKIVYKTDCFIALNQSIQDDLLAEGIQPSKISCIPNGICISEPRTKAKRVQCRKSLSFPELRPVISTVGTLTPKKNHANLIRALSLIPAEQRPLLVIAGGGGLRNSLESLIQELDLSEDIRLLGQVSSEEVNQVLHASDLFILPSYVEGVSNALLEAMAIEIPAIVSDVPGNRAVIENDSQGYFCHPDNPVSISRAISDALQNPSEMTARARAGRLNIESRFDLDVVAKQYELLYGSLLNSTK